jgi:hypothetical protein
MKSAFLSNVVKASVVLLIVAAFTTFGCDQKNPDEPDDGTDSDTVAPSPVWTWTCDDEAPDESTQGMSHYPLGDGAKLSYWHFGGLEEDNGSWIDNEDSWENVTTVQDTDFSDAHGHPGPFFMVEDTPTQNLRKVTRDWLQEENGVILRVHKKEAIEDSPDDPILEVDYYLGDKKPIFIDDTIMVDEYQDGFKRFDNKWLSQEPGWSEVVSYNRQDVTGGIESKEETRSHRFTVVALDQTVIVAAGTFEGCIQIKRERLNDTDFNPDPDDPNGTRGTVKQYWFCPGVGKVKEKEIVDDDNPRTEELLYHCVPDGLCCPSTI